MFDELTWWFVSILTAIVSSMGSRLILSGLSFYDEDKSPANYLEINTFGRRQSIESNIPGSEWF
jgi:hypothetical protein